MKNIDGFGQAQSDSSSAKALDASVGADATLHLVERVFDRTDGENTDAGERTQNRRLTLLQGGVKRRPFVRPGAPVSTTFPVVRDALRHDEPLKRYKHEHSLPPLWSATATWADLTVQQEVPNRLDLPTGWGDRWSLTYRHGSHDLTASIASVSARDLLVADPVRVNSCHPNKTSRAGLRYMHSTDRHHAHESLFERKLLSALDFHGVTDIASQPFTLTWHDGVRDRHHTPDFLAQIDGQMVVINTRPAELVKDRLLEDATAVAEMCFARGWGHALVVGYPLPAFTTVDTVRVHARAHDALGYGDDIVEFLDAFGPTEFATVCHQFEGHIVARAILQRLIWDRQVSIELNRPLEDWTLVALPGQEASA